MSDTPADVRTLPTDELAERLRAWAYGWYPGEAAVELLAMHRTWLVRGELLTACVRSTEDGWNADAPTLMATIDWETAARLLDEGGLVGSSSELQILAAAVSLAGETVQTYDLANMVTGLDTINVALVLNALAHAAGWHERPTKIVVTGHLNAAENS